MWKSHENDAWWYRVGVTGIGMVGPNVEFARDVASVIEVTRLMYAHLQNCAHFRFACVGWEREECLNIDDLLHPKIELPAGLVVNNEVWLQMGSPTDFQPFGKGSVWKPLQEEDYRTIAQWG